MPSTQRDHRFRRAGRRAPFRGTRRESLEGPRLAIVWSRFPKFVLGFLLLSSLASARLFAPAQAASLANLSRWAFLLTFAGVGLKTNFAELRRQGLRPLVVGALGEVGIALVTLGMVLVADGLAALGGPS